MDFKKKFIYGGTRVKLCIDLFGEHLQKKQDKVIKIENILSFWVSIKTFNISMHLD